MIPIVLTIAGSDSSAGAGIQADLKAISANGGYGASVLTAITAQNTRGVTAAVELDLDLIRAQADAVFDDLRVGAVKTGMLASAAVIETVAKVLRDRRPPHYVLDPVMVSKTGFPLLRPEAVGALRETLLPLATLVTPNVHEAEALRERGLDPGPGRGGGPPVDRRGRSGRVRQGRTSRGAAGNGRPGRARRRAELPLPGEHVDARHTHGTGCTYSAAIATQLAHGRSLEDAIVRAKAYVTEAIRAGLPVGEGIGPTDHFFYLRRPGECERWVGGLAGAESQGEAPDPPSPRDHRAPSRTASPRGAGAARGRRWGRHDPVSREGPVDHAAFMEAPTLCDAPSTAARSVSWWTTGSTWRSRPGSRRSPRPGRPRRGDGAPGPRRRRPDRRHGEQPPGSPPGRRHRR